MRLQVSLGVAASLIASASAHATWQSIWVNSVDGGSSCLRMAASNNPVTDVTSTVGIYLVIRSVLWIF